MTATIALSKPDAFSGTRLSRFASRTRVKFSTAKLTPTPVAITVTTAEYKPNRPRKNQTSDQIAAPMAALITNSRTCEWSTLFSTLTNRAINPPRPNHETPSKTAATEPITLSRIPSKPASGPPPRFPIKVGNCPTSPPRNVRKAISKIAAKRASAIAVAVFDLFLAFRVIKKTIINLRLCRIAEPTSYAFPSQLTNIWGYAAIFCAKPKRRHSREIFGTRTEKHSFSARRRAEPKKIAG